MIIERIPEDSWQDQHGHIYRYQLAATYLNPGERVLDIASGIGYGAQILQNIVPVQYLGADKVEPVEQFAKLGTFYSGIDLNDWTPDFTWDVSISFETLEHLEHPEKLAAILMQAKRLIILSTPTRPTKHLNHFHLHDFTVEQVFDYFPGWEVQHLEDQPEELSHIFIFSKKGQ